MEKLNSLCGLLSVRVLSKFDDRYFWVNVVIPKNVLFFFFFFSPVLFLGSNQQIKS